MSKEIEALLIERIGYVNRKLSARVKAVDDALSALGYKTKETPKETATAEPTEERAVISAPIKRKKA
jgi:Holliday junction resolvasome RuvABC DNA-binding subunit